MDEPIKHHRVTIIFHWITVVALTAVFISALFRDWIDDDDMRLSLLNLHRSLGLLIFAIAALRLLARFRFYSSDVAALLIPLEKRIAAIAHSAIYVLLLSTPLLGWLLTSASGKSFIFFGLAQLPALMAKNRAIAENLGEIHEIFAYTLLAIIGIHSAAALWHHFVRKDHILAAILPGKSKNRSEESHS